ncbi:hypothetical protein HK100_001954 [Physocladia obscura]|uniref:Uncharacterized protein n=1 Tax=Physocladia obscura TaxID=109957 RepID=A0AAD5T8Q3_9FUNG|nr:hypothetical protein HK100_001954 [Physocladia obscura]
MSTEEFARIDDFFDSNDTDVNTGIAHPFELIWDQSGEESMAVGINSVDGFGANDAWFATDELELYEYTLRYQHNRDKNGAAHDFAAESNQFIPSDYDYNQIDDSNYYYNYDHNYTGNFQTDNENYHDNLDENISYHTAQLAISQQPEHTRTSDANFGILTQTPKPEICRHLLAGGCYRSDCWFSHDVSNTTCKFFLSGGCNKGSDCPFLHSEDYDNTNPTEYEEFYTNDDNFNDNDNSNQLPVELQLQDGSIFPTLSDRHQQQRNPTIDFWGPTISYNEALKQAPPRQSDADYRFNIGVAKPAPQGTALRYMTESDHNNGSSEGKKVKVDGLKWLSTGGSVASLYSKHRQEAAEAAETRNRLYQRAADAFRSGNVAAAKSFSNEAKKVDHVVQQLNREASERIFATRNATLGNSGGGTSGEQQQERIIDLHGLHGSEGVYYAETALAGLRKEKFHGTVTIVTGTGHHSRSSFAKIGPLIRDFLRASKTRFREGTLEDGKGGLFIFKI